MDAVRLIASDMDHTLLDENGELPPGFHEYVRRLNAAGVTFVAASGRPPVRLKLMFPPREGIGHIGDNGGTVSYHDTILFQSLLATRSYHDMAARTLASTQGVPVICGVDAAFVLSDHREHVAELHGFYPEITLVESLADVHADADKFTIFFPEGDSREFYETVFRPAYGDEFSVTMGGPNWVDLMNRGVHKGHGIRVLAEHLGLRRHEMMAFGDALNDVEMLDEVEHSYAVSNADESVRKRARFAAASNAEHGVLRVIEQVLAAREG
ncbi:MAG: HAD family hydrolase [Micropruina sp.]|nr:HAD family hydrolase [Micropruina sp.]